MTRGPLGGVLASLGGDPLGRLVASGAVGSLSFSVVGIGLIVLLQIMLARILGVEQYGVYSYALAWMEILSLFAGLGLDTAALRFMPAYRAQREWGVLKGFMTGSAVMVALVALLVGAGTALLSSSPISGLHGDLGLVLLLASALIPVNAVLQIAAAHLQALGRIYRAQGPPTLIRPVAMAALLLLYVSTTDRPLGATVAILCNVTAAVATLVITLTWARRHLPLEISEVIPEYRVSEWIKVSIPLLLGAGLYLLMQRIDVLLIGALLDTTQAGIYSAALRLSGLSVLGITAVNMVTARLFSEFFSAGKKHEMQKSIAMGSVMVLALSLPGILVALFFGRVLLGVFGDEFIAGYDALRILLIGPLVCVGTWAVGLLASMTGFQTQKMVLLAGALVLNVVLNLLLIPRFGIEGAALSSAVALVSWQITMVVLIGRKLRLDPTVLSIRLLSRGGPLQGRDL